MAAAGGAFGGNRGMQPLAPEKGVFPLDHLQECKHEENAVNAINWENPNAFEAITKLISHGKYFHQPGRSLAMREYMQCLKESKFSSERCRRLSSDYLKCRMDRNLMVKQDLSELGYREGETPNQGENLGGVSVAADEVHKNERNGFISGLPLKQTRNAS